MAESEADTPSTPIEFESKYFEFDGVRLPPFCRGKMEEIASFSLRSSDIWIVTYPKSGKPPVRHRAKAALRLQRSWVRTDATPRCLSAALSNITGSLRNKRFEGRKRGFLKTLKGLSGKASRVFLRHIYARRIVVFDKCANKLNLADFEKS